MHDSYFWLIIAVIALVTAALRYLPFFVFRDGRKIPKKMEQLGEVLPYAIMGMLVIYCLKEVHFVSISGFVPALIACVAVGVLYVWKRNTLLSILFGTICYMILVQRIF